MEKNTGKFLTQQVISQIEQRILKKNLSPGNFFATEDQLCQELDVSRSVIRDAVGRLRGLGVLESKRNVGLVIGQVDPMELFETGLTFYSSTFEDITSLAQIRFILEMGAIEFAIRNLIEKQLVDMENLTNMLEELTKNKSPVNTNIEKFNETFNEIDMKFHKIIMEASGNILLKQMHSIITTHYITRAEELKKHFNEGLPEDQGEIAIKEHRAIVNAFRSKNFEYAKSILMVHLWRNVEKCREVFLAFQEKDNKSYFGNQITEGKEVSTL